jgi:hypothetical protein
MPPRQPTTTTAAGPTLLRCSDSPNVGADARVLLVATISGRDTGVSVVSNLVNSLPGHHLRSFAASAGWIHLAEFTRRWVDMRIKMTKGDHPDHAYFKQFLSSDRDGFPSTDPDTDFRSMPELVRRRIKPAWYHFYNMSNVMCGVRNLFISSISPARTSRVFGFLHAFSDFEENKGRLAEYKGTTASMVLSSLDLFLALFPLGKVIIHLPFSASPRREIGQPRCVCPAAARCSASQANWPDNREHMLQQLLRFHRHRPNRTLLTVGSEEFYNMSRFAGRVTKFLHVPAAKAAAVRAGLRAWTTWTGRLRRDGVLSIRRGSYFQADLVRERLQCTVDDRIASTGVWMCPQTRCARPQPRSNISGEENATCTVCHTSLGEWGWRRWSTGDGEAPSTTIGDPTMG